jgi:hypothetical protein
MHGLLEDRQDTVVASAALRKMAMTVGTTAEENGFT